MRFALTCVALALSMSTGVGCADCARGARVDGADPLPSWNQGASKKAITDFVAKVTTEGSPDFVKPAERIAVFDNDGTLWCEQPVYVQLAFAVDRAKADPETLKAGGEKAMLELVARTHSGMTTEEFNAIVKDWIKTARHPKYNRPYNELVYQPMLELLDYLRARGFKTFIVSGGGVEFMRAFAEETYGIPPEQVVGSSGVVKFEMKDHKPVLVKQPKIEFIDDKEGKPVGINRFIGRRPVMAFGNSDGDLQMLQYTTAGDSPRFAMIVHHTDDVREVAYDRASHIGKLDRALDEATQNGWTVVDMKNEWKTVFPSK